MPHLHTLAYFPPAFSSTGNLQSYDFMYHNLMLHGSLKRDWEEGKIYQGSNCFNSEIEWSLYAIMWTWFIVPIVHSGIQTVDLVLASLHNPYCIDLTL